ncbi:MAG: copper amine oxidase N-terminal domain-containing protein, partial [Tissierellales bacterium]
AIVKRDYTDANTLEMWRTYDEGEYLTLYEYSRVLELTIGSKMKILNVVNSIYGENELYSGGHSELEMDTSPIVKDSRTYLPIKYLAESFGYEVSWDSETQTVNLTSTHSIDGTYVSDIISSFSNFCVIGLYETDYTILNRDFISVEKAVIQFKDGRIIDVTESIIDTTDELKETFVDFSWDINVAYGGKIEYDFSPEENKVFRVKTKVNIADKDGNIGYQTYIFYFDITDGEGGYL